MPISTPSGIRLITSVTLAAASAIAAAQAAPEIPQFKPNVASTAEGQKAMDALAAAQTQWDANADKAIPPPNIPPPSPALRKRAFDALRSRTSNPRFEERARAARKAGEAQLARDHEAMSKRLAEALGLEAPSTMAVAQAVAPPPPGLWVPVLFVSSSVPIATLRSYAGQLERTHGVLAFRGMPGGLDKVGPMAKLSAQILRLDPGCEGPACAMRNVQLIVDPILFRQHGVNHVPALAMLPGDPTKPYCEREEEGAASVRSSHLVYGDAALTGMLETYARLGGKEEVRDAQSRLERW